MASRRSRLQIKPNIGPKPGRGALPAVASKPDTKLSRIIKKPEPSDADQPVKDEIEKVATLVEDVPAEKPQENPQDVIPSNKEKCDSSEQAKSVSEVEDTKETLVESVEVEEKTDVKTDTKPDARPKFRSRFTKAKPNLAKVGRPDNRKVPKVKSPVAPRPEPEPEVQKPTEPPKTETEQEKIKEVHISSSNKKPESPKIDVANTTEVQRKIIPEVHVSSEEEEEEEMVIEHRVDKPAEKHAEKSIFDKPVTPILKQEKKPVKKPTGGKRKKFLPPVDKPPNRATMKMIDLIYWNPSSNPMKRKASQQKPNEAPDGKLAAASEEENRVDTPGLDQDEDSNALPVPQVKIGPDGNIIINETSLVVDNKMNDEPVEAEVIEEDESTVNYKSFRERRSKTSWSELETKKFYKALSTVGTDFSLMLNLFPRRTRREIKNKFKKEERFNRIEVDKAIKIRTDFDMTDFEKFEEEAVEEERVKEELAQAKKAEKHTKNGRKRKARGDDIKENKAVKKRKKKKKKSAAICEETDEEEDENAERSDEDSPKKPGSHRVEEVVEILMGLSQGRPPTGFVHSRKGSDVSDAESDAPSEAPSVMSEVSVFIPKNVRANLNKKIRKCNVEEDRTVDNQILAPDIEPSGDIRDLVNNVLSNPWPSQFPAYKSSRTGTVSLKREGDSANSNNNCDVPTGSMTPSVSAGSGTPTVSTVSGTPTVSAVSGTPTVSAVSGTSTVSAVSRTPPLPVVSETPTDPAVSETPTVPAISVMPDSNTVGPIEVQNMEIPEGLLPVINTAGGADKVQIVLVHDVDSESGQTVVHVYILPKTAEELSIGGNTVQLTPTKSKPQQDSVTSQCSTSEQSWGKQAQGHNTANFEIKLSEHSSAISVTTCSSTVPSSPVTPFQRQSSKSVTLAQTAAQSVMKTVQSQEAAISSTLTPSSLSTSSLMTPGTSDTWSHSLVDDPVTPGTLLSPTPASRVCLFKDEVTTPVDPVDLTIKKEV